MRKPLTHGHELKRPGLAVIQRFLSKVKANGTGCWDWQGCKSGRPSQEYGQFKLAGKARGAHRVAYAIFNGTVPEGLDVHHTCANTMCVNPDHLEAVLRSDNTAEGNTRRNGPPF